MPKIKLPDGSVKEFDKPINFDELASSIGSGLRTYGIGKVGLHKLTKNTQLILEQLIWQT